MGSVFICYSSKDKFFAKEFADRLKVHGVKFWLDEVELKIGDSLTGRIGTAIEENDFLAVVLSRHSIESEWVQKELQVALQKELREKKVVVLPLLLEPVTLPPFLQDKLYADFTDAKRFDESFPKVLKAIGVPDKRIPRSGPPEPGPPPRGPISEAQRRLEIFQDIHIIDLDSRKTYNPDARYILLNMYLRLSGTPPGEWAEIFEAERRFPRHSMWRRAWIEADYIVIYCVPDELEKYHLRDLREDVASANTKYREHLSHHARKDAAETVRRKDEQKELADLRQRLGFD